MKAINPNKKYEYVPEWAKEVTVHYVQPYGSTIPTTSDKSGFFDQYLDKFITGIDGLEIPEGAEGSPWSNLIPPRLANEMFIKLSALKTLEDTEKEG